MRGAKLGVFDLHLVNLLQRVQTWVCLELARSSQNRSPSPRYRSTPLQRLTDLHLCSTQLSGAIPCVVASLASLSNLHLFDNELRGAIPCATASLANLNYLLLGKNRLGV